LLTVSIPGQRRANGQKSPTGAISQKGNTDNHKGQVIPLDNGEHPGQGKFINQDGQGYQRNT